ncbi:MAG: glycosyltransferase family 4 protein [Candidatus Omnitrophica bacterium]|nr:glycosyltransferase family 4 protein [Candidatus Omnitrophota bacterium]
MRILFIGHNGYEYPHTRVRCYHFARMLSKHPRVETSVLSFRDDLAPHKTEADIYNLRDREKVVLTAKAVWRLLQEKNTVVYIQKAHFHAAAPYWLYRMGWLKSYIFDYDDYDIPLSNFFYRGTLNRLFFGSNRWDEITFRLIRNAAGCVASSRELCSLMQEHNPKVSYIPTGVDADVFKPSAHKPSSAEAVVLWNGLVWGEPILKNIRMLFSAFQRARIQAPNLRLLLAGGGAAWPDLKKVAADRFSDVPIEWREWIDPREMPALLQSVDIGVLPLEGEDRWLRCKSPTKLFEYMSAGLPVIASAVGEASHVIEHQKSGLLAQNEADFSDLLIALAQNPEQRMTLSAHARERIESNYALPVLGERLYHFLQSIFPVLAEKSA